MYWGYFCFIEKYAKNNVWSTGSAARKCAVFVMNNCKAKVGRIESSINRPSLIVFTWLSFSVRNTSVAPVISFLLYFKEMSWYWSHPILDLGLPVVVIHNKRIVFYCSLSMIIQMTLPSRHVHSLLRWLKLMFLIASSMKYILLIFFLHEKSQRSRVAC